MAKYNVINLKIKNGELIDLAEKSDAEQCLEELKALGLPCAIVGEVTEKREKKIEVR